MYIPGAVEEAGEEWGVSHSMIVLIGMLMLAAGLETAIFILSRPEIGGGQQATAYQPIRSPRDAVGCLDARTE